MRPCYTITAAASADKPAVLSIFEDIGFWGTQAKDFIASLNAVKSKDIEVEINSPGGDVFAAVTMYNALRATGKNITTRVMGVAASAASYVLMAGDKRVMPKNTHVMVHNPMTSVFMGNADDMDEASAMLRKVGTTLHATYASRTGMDDAALTEMLAKDTWLTADEALEHGFATEVVDDVRATASFDMARADLPEKVRAVYASAQQTPEEIETARLAKEEEDRVEAQRIANEAIASAKDPAVAQQINDLTVKAGLTAYAPVFAIACATVAEAETRITSAKEIVAICAFAKKPEAAAAFVKANKPVADVRAALVTAMAEGDEHVSTTPPNKSSTPNAGTSGVSASSLWKSHNEQQTRKRKE